MAEHNQDESFKVVDRRLFTAEGELRKEVAEEQQREKSAPAKTAPAPAKGEKGDGAQKSQPAAPPADETASSSAAEPVSPSRGFQMLVNFLAQNAAAMLGGMADPRTGKAFLDLEGAREMIDMLDALREKTMKNLAAEDEQILIEVIGSLKLTFMEVSRVADQALRDKAKAGNL